MSDIDERNVRGHRVRIDRDLCVGFGDCIEVSGEAFEFDDQGIAVFRDGFDDVDHDTLLAACDECPVDAISVFDPEGRQLVP